MTRTFRECSLRCVNIYPNEFILQVELLDNLDLIGEKSLSVNLIITGRLLIPCAHAI